VVVAAAPVRSEAPISNARPAEPLKSRAAAASTAAPANSQPVAGAAQATPNAIISFGKGPTSTAAPRALVQPAAGTATAGPISTPGVAATPGLANHPGAGPQPGPMPGPGKGEGLKPGPNPGPGASPGPPKPAPNPAPQVALNPKPGINDNQLGNLNARLGNLLPAGRPVTYSDKRYSNDISDAIAAVKAEYYKKAAPPQKVLDHAQGRIYRKRTITHPDQVTYVIRKYKLFGFEICTGWTVTLHPEGGGAPDGHYDVGPCKGSDFTPAYAGELPTISPHPSPTPARQPSHL
jgi:hypothetical protein